MLLYIQSYTLPHHNMTYYKEEAMKAMTSTEEPAKVIFHIFFIDFCPHWDSNPITPE